jgi:hypothetical protein
MKSIMMGAQAIMCGDAEIVVAGGMENMSLIPHYVTFAKWRINLDLTSMVDGMQKDGLHWMLTTITPWAFLPIYVLLNIKSLVKNKILLLFNRMSVLRKLGMLENLIQKLYLLPYPHAKAIRLW